MEGKTDEAYRRVKSLLDGLLEQGRKALETKPEDLVGKGNLTKVLSEEEQRVWLGDGDADTLSALDPNESRPITPFSVSGSVSGLQDKDSITTGFNDLDDKEKKSQAQVQPQIYAPSPLSISRSRSNDTNDATGTASEEEVERSLMLDVDDVSSTAPNSPTSLDLFTTATPPITVSPP